MTRLVSLCVCAFLGPAVVWAEGDDPAVADPAIWALVEQLDDENFAQRQAAEERLAEAGRPAIDVLRATAAGGNPEVAARAVAILERMFVRGCLAVADEAERALEALTAGPEPDVAQRARAILAGNQQLRERRALAALHELGAKIDFMPQSEHELARLRGAFPGVEGPVELPGRPPVKLQIWLLKDWTGGEEGLWHVARLEDNWGLPIWGLTLYQVKGNGVPIEAVQQLAARVPKLEVHFRGASLGIQSQEGEPCFVSKVIDSSPAKNAGIEPGDIIRAFNGDPIKRFSDLVGQLLDRTPGETVTIHVQRGGEIIELPVELGDWRDVNTGQRSGSFFGPQFQPPPPPDPNGKGDPPEKER